MRFREVKRFGQSDFSIKGSGRRARQPTDSSLVHLLNRNASVSTQYAQPMGSVQTLCLFGTENTHGKGILSELRLRTSGCDSHR